MLSWRLVTIVLFCLLQKLCHTKVLKLPYMQTHLFAAIKLNATCHNNDLDLKHVNLLCCAKKRNVGISHTSLLVLKALVCKSHLFFRKKFLFNFVWILNNFWGDVFEKRNHVHHWWWHIIMTHHHVHYLLCFKILLFFVKFKTRFFFSNLSFSGN